MTPSDTPEPALARVLPHPRVCRTRTIGVITGFGSCLVERPIECPYVLYFGEGNICRHPSWKGFMLAPETESPSEAENPV